ncbi:hypothetical protein CTheo_6156 [Ceratobasidium theobromae]|uniref:Endonuclease/exonuclease/phosphatase domain-containing protein n=1 Tax=Ceratobasidium theobromae TaxID=1582974 RepID=A0A5N5QF59_9AGAM|nr:hypothetical protein CTheo_6156 [Ceratobasidium theobromae]
MVSPRRVLFSALVAWTASATAAPTQAVLGLADTGTAPTPATVQTSNTTLDTTGRDESAIQVLTFNCWGLRFVSQDRLARITAIADRILNASPAYDVVALQELWLKSDHALVAETVAPVLPYSTVFYSGAFGSGLSLFSRYPIEQAQMHPFALAGDPIDVFGGDWFVGKGVAAATLSHPVLGHIELLTSHMFARGGETGTVLQQAHRLVGAWEYSQLIRRAAELGRYVIVAGDFNAVDGSAPLEFIRTHAKVQDAWWATHNLTSPAVPVVFPLPTEGAATSALAAIHEHGVTADSPLNSWSAGKPLDAVARRHLGKRLDYVLYRGPDARATWELVAKEAKVVMTERMPDLGVSLSDHFGVQVELAIVPAGVSTQNQSNAGPSNLEILPPLPIPPPVARTRALILHDTLHVLHAAIPASYAASTAYLTTGIACAFSLVALAVAAGAVGWGPNAKSYRRRTERSSTTPDRENQSPVRPDRKRSRSHTTPSSQPQSQSTPSPNTTRSPLSSPPPPPLRLPFLPAKSSLAKRGIQAPWWLGIVLVLVGALLAAAGITLLYAGVLFGRWERNAIWDVIDQMERLGARGGIDTMYATVFTNSGGYRGPMRREPPQPLGTAATYFPISAATPLAPNADPHPSGYSIRVKLDNPHPGSPFRTSELVSGRVHVYAPPGTKTLSAPRLSLRVYFESRTLFWGLEPKQAGKIGQKLDDIKSSRTQTYENVTKHEVHRGIVPSTNITPSWDTRSAVDVEFQPRTGADSDEVVMNEANFPFSFVVPREMDVTEWNECDGAPRDLCHVKRCPPPTVRNWGSGSVQWVVEAIMDLVPNARGEEDETMLRLPTRDQVLTRLVFPVVPCLEDVSELKNVPFFGDDLRAARFGIRRLSETEMEGKKATMERMRARGGTWEGYVKETCTLNKCIVQSELYAPAGARISTSDSELPLVLFLKHTGTQSNAIKSFFRSSKPKAVYLRRVLVSLMRATATRGGKEVKPHTRNTVLRRREIRLADSEESTHASSSASTLGLVIPASEAAPLELDLTLDLQSQIEIDLVSNVEQPAPSIPARELIPSFRTPNIQYEYLLTVTLWFAEDEMERFAAHFPVQVVPGGENLPLFGDVDDTRPPLLSEDPELPRYEPSS